MAFSFELATQADDLAIRRLLATHPMPGSVTVSYEREPDYFLGCGVMGRTCQVIVARQRESGELAGVLCRATRPCYVNGQRTEIGYLGQLRVDRRFQGHWLSTRSIPILRQLHAEQPVSGYLATITNQNRIAQGLLVARPRRSFPSFRPVSGLQTLAIILRSSRRMARWTTSCTPARADELEEIVAFLREHGAARQFFPVYSLEDFTAGGATRGFSPQDFIVARCGSRIAGVLGLWDQSAYKQTVVRGYSGALRWLRPIYNLHARVAGGWPLPAPNQPIRHIYASFICVANHDRACFDQLLKQAYRLAAERGYAYLMLGLSAADPLLPVAREHPHILYDSTLYTVGWNDEGSFHEQLDSRPAALEIAAL